MGYAIWMCINFLVCNLRFFISVIHYAIGIYLSFLALLCLFYYFSFVNYLNFIMKILQIKKITFTIFTSKDFFKTFILRGWGSNSTDMKP